MIYSMTGYGKGTAGNNKFSVEVELKSVNSRYLETFLKMPAVLSTYEYELREILRAKIKRGKINVVVQLKKGGIENGFTSVDQHKLKSYVEFIGRIKKSAKLKDELKLDHLLNNVELFTSVDSEIGQKEFNFVKQALNKAIENLLQMKQKEGAELLKDLNQRTEKIKAGINNIEKEFKKGVKDYYSKLRQRIKELIQDYEPNEERLTSELALIADRTDITEECVRLKSHLKLFNESLKNESEPGRKLNFICQEMNREANTISAKSIVTPIIHTSVRIKEEIEKIREQIQNIE
jgi:uncharacterized protein (TIGR00255 family)